MNILKQMIKAILLNISNQSIKVVMDIRIIMKPSLQELLQALMISYIGQKIYCQLCKRYHK
jgi:hypothetical protein